MLHKVFRLCCVEVLKHIIILNFQFSILNYSQFSTFNFRRLQVRSYVAAEVLVGKINFQSLFKRFLQSLGLVFAI